MNEESPSVSSDLSNRLSEYAQRGENPSGTVVVSEEEVYVGDEIPLKARNLTPETTYNLLWHSVDGQWGVIEANEITGPQYTATEQTISTIETDEKGNFDGSFEIPQDYGGDHQIELRTTDGKSVDRTEITVRPRFELERTKAPLGEAIYLTGYGLGPNPVSNNFQVTWDNVMVGYVTGVQNNGTATAGIRAVGPPGDHVIRVWRNYRGVPFLQNNTQSPYGPVAGDRPAKWEVTVEPPDPSLPTTWTDEMLPEHPIPVHYPDLDRETDAELSIEPTSGVAGTEATIVGRNFPANETVNLVWHRHEDDFESTSGVVITEKPNVLPTVTTDNTGEFVTTVTLPRDKGGTRPITARIGGDSVAVTGFVLQPRLLDVSPTSGPAGTEIEIEIEGIGWTAYSTMFFTYDNGMMGYVCGNNDTDEHGITRTRFEATGGPGIHLIEAYPTIFETKDDGLNVEIKPHLSYLDNHPVRPLPAMHATFEITEE